MSSFRTAIACSVACMAMACAATAGDVPPALSGALVFSQDNGDYVALDNAMDAPIHVVLQARGQPDAAYWRDDGLRMLTWRGDIARVRMPHPGSAATITNAVGQCLTARGADDIRWNECRGGAPNQVWTAADGTLVAAPPFQGYLAYGDPQDGTRLHIVRGDAPLTLVTSVLSATD